MPADQRIEPAPALVVPPAGVECPAGDVGIGGNASCIRSSSAAGGVGQIGIETRGTVEHPQSRLVQAHTASGRAGNRIVSLLAQSACLARCVGQLSAQCITARLRTLQAL